MWIFLLLFFLPFFAESKTHTAIVSIAPYRFFVEQIAGDSVRVILLVPPGASFHDYEPSPKQVIESANADLWFRVGETFETKASKVLQSYNPQLKIIDLREGVDLILVGQQGSEVCPHCYASGADLHMWLSPKQVAIQARHIAQALIEMYPEHRDEYQKRLNDLLWKLQALDQEITIKLRPLKNRVIMVGHPAYAYFARDYNLKQLPIEYEGKDPSAHQLNQILNSARQANIKTIYVQNQYSSKGAKLIANELGAKVVILEPYGEEYFSSLRNIAQSISEQQ